AAGFRPPEGTPVDDGVGQVPSLPLPVPFAAAADLHLWQVMSQPSSVLAVFDASGSMDFMAGDQSRMQLAVGVAKTALDVFPDRARIGLWVFSIDQGGPGQDWRELEPMRRLDAVVDGVTQRDQLDGRAEEMLTLTNGGTGLYDTTLAAYQQALRDYDPTYSNSVILMTDGANDDPGSISLDRLVHELEKAHSPKRPVRIIGIGISDDADYAALKRIAKATGGEAYSADTPEDILGVFAQAIASR
ncbi:VWA domain-containing protein, partial [Nocardioides hankookensis]